MERTKQAARILAERLADHYGETYYVVSLGRGRVAALDEEGVENHAGRVLSQHQPSEREGNPRKQSRKRH